MTDGKKRLVLYHSHANPSKICAYCQKHKVGMTARQIRKKQCLVKQCYHLQRYDDHSYWRMREVRKARREIRRYQASI